MKINTLFLAGQLSTAAIVGVLTLIATQASHWAVWLAPLALTLPFIFGICLMLTRRIKSGLCCLEVVVAKHGEASFTPCGLHEFDVMAEQIAHHARRWDEIAANHQEQVRELHAILLVLNRRDGQGNSSNTQLRNVLSGIGHSLHQQVTQLENSSVEMGNHTQAIAESAEAQGNAVIKTGAYVEQLSTNFDTVSRNSNTVHDAIQSTRQSAEEALQLVHQLTEGINRIRCHSETSERKIRSLGDPSRQIGAILGTIGDITARTELLALNASIESIRAGEHGRGFAIVADEVRKLSEQAAQATSEITGLLEAMQLKTQESISVIAQERSEVASEVEIAAATESLLKQICQTTEEDATVAKEITASTEQQLQLTEDVVEGLEQILQDAKSERSRAQNVSWTMKSITESLNDFDHTADKLRSLSGNRPAKKEGDEKSNSDRVASEKNSTDANELVQV